MPLRVHYPFIYPGTRNDRAVCSVSKYRAPAQLSRDLDGGVTCLNCLAAMGRREDKRRGPKRRES